MDGQPRVEQVAEADAAGLGGQAEQGPVGVQGPPGALGVHVQAVFFGPVDEPVVHLAGGEWKVRVTHVLPGHSTATAVTGSPGTTPRTRAPGVTSSNRAGTHER
ncbi:MAG: hypothetical protein ACRDZQ_08505 [Acidimicrobiales bacterium]